MSALIRPPGTYIRAGAEWFEVQYLESGAVTPSLNVHEHEGDEWTPRLVSFADEIMTVRASVVLSGVRFEAGSFWRGSTRIRHAVPADSTDIIAALWRYGPDDREVAKLVPGAVYHDPRGSNGGVTVEMPLAELPPYVETVTPVIGVRQGDDRYFARLDARTPRAFFRRRIDGDFHIDEVLRGRAWEPDVHGSVRHAIERMLDSDLEELTRDEAHEVEVMVRTGEYRPLAPRSARENSLLQLRRYANGFGLTSPKPDGRPEGR